MSEMIERVAQAAHKAAYDSRGSRDITLGPDWMAVARAAIAAMREPTDQMIDAAVCAERGGTVGDLLRSEWMAMINAALQE